MHTTQHFSIFHSLYRKQYTVNISDQTSVNDSVLGLLIHIGMWINKPNTE